MAGFTVKAEGGSVIVETDDYTLIFSEAPVGITSFYYKKDGVEHDVVGDMVYPMTLFQPFFYAGEISGAVLWSDGGTSIEVEKNFDWFVQIKQTGYMRNPVIPTCTDFPFNVTWYLWPSGRIGCRMEIKNLSGFVIVVEEEAYRLNPANDADISPERDTAPSLEWFGFQSNNTGSGAEDLSHDVICVPYVSSLNSYDASGKINRIYDNDVTWLNSETLTRWFLLALSVDGSWGDCANGADIQSRGDEISADLKNPDPLDGSADAGDILTGTLIGTGFDEYTSAITVGV